MSYNNDWKKELDPSSGKLRPKRSRSDSLTEIARLRAELERLRDVVCEEDVASIDAILEGE